jgi:hypothetical protein
MSGAMLCLSPAPTESRFPDVKHDERDYLAAGGGWRDVSRCVADRGLGALRRDGGK